MLFRSRRERNLWLLTAGYVLAVYFSLGSIRAVTDFLRDRNLLRVSIAALFALAAAGVLAWMVRRRAGRREWAVLALAAAGYAALMPLARRAEEQLHLIEYGLMGALIYAAASERRRAGTRPLTAAGSASPPAGDRAGDGPASSREGGGGPAPPRPPVAGDPAVAAPAWTAFLAATALGWIDEGIQDLLPRRYYGLQDLVVNAVSAGLAVFALALLETVRRRRSPS